MAKKSTQPPPQQEEKSGKRRLPKGVRTHIRRLKSEGRNDEAAAMRKAENRKSEEPK